MTLSATLLKKTPQGFQDLYAKILKELEAAQYGVNVLTDLLATITSGADPLSSTSPLVMAKTAQLKRYEAGRDMCLKNKAMGEEVALAKFGPDDTPVEDTPPANDPAPSLEIPKLAARSVTQETLTTEEGGSGSFSFSAMEVEGTFTGTPAPPVIHKKNTAQLQREAIMQNSRDVSFGGSLPTLKWSSIQQFISKAQ